MAGKSKYVPVHIDEARRRLQPPRCAAGHPFVKYSTWSQCQACARYGSVARGCMTCWVWMCARCAAAHEEEQVPPTPRTHARTHARTPARAPTPGPARRPPPARARAPPAAARQVAAACPPTRAQVEARP